MLSLMLTLHLLAPQPTALRPLTLLPTRVQLEARPSTPYVREYLVATGAAVATAGVAALIVGSVLVVSPSSGALGLSSLALAGVIYAIGAPLTAALTVTELARHFDRPGGLGAAIGGALLGGVLGVGIAAASFWGMLVVLNFGAPVVGDVVEGPGAWRTAGGIALFTTGVLLGCGAMGAGAVIGLNLSRDSDPPLLSSPPEPSPLLLAPPLTSRVAPTQRGLIVPVFALHFG